MSNKGAGAKKEEKEGSGLLGTLLVAGGAAALGYMACDLWKSFQETRPSTSAAHGGGGGGGPRPGGGGGGGPRPSPDSDQTMKARQKTRQQAHDKDVPEAVRCIICCDNPREVMTVPCNHAAMCIDCADEVTRCPVCQLNIQARKNVYLP